ncbi:MAG: sigma-70 family RNA polymerase sigma factor [Planctomycetes bacterium]|nr:sigma-70 family RNA polymerase sigma factor [Planctomycetota bacterium]
MNSTPASLLDRLAGSGREDRSAWERFVELYTPLMVSWCQQLRMSDADAADFMQEVFLVLIERLPHFKYDPEKSFRAWLKTILMNSWRNHLRRISRAGADQADLDALAESDPALLREESEHRGYLVRRALDLMKQDFEPTTWNACWEFVVHSRPAQDVAAELGITVNAVYLAKSRVLRHLRTELNGLLE